MKVSVQRLLLSLGSTAIMSFVWVTSALASIGPVPDPGGGNVSDLHAIILQILNAVVNFLGILMIIAIVVAGFRLVLSQGEEEAKEKAKKGVMYAIIGLILVLLAKAIVLFVTTTFGVTV